jgi:hypothetical protein
VFAPGVYRVTFASARLSYNHAVRVVVAIGTATKPRDGAFQMMHLRTVDAHDNAKVDRFRSKKSLEGSNNPKPPDVFAENNAVRAHLTR